MRVVSAVGILARIEWFNLSELLLFFGLWLIAWLPVATVLSRAVSWQPFQPLNPAQKIPLVLSLYAIAPLILGAILVWYGLNWRTIGLSSVHQLSQSFFNGLGLGLSSFGLLFGLVLACGWASPSFSWGQPNPNSQTPDQPQNEQKLYRTVSAILGLTLLLFLLSLGIGFIEELVFRGFLTSRLATTVSLGSAGAIASFIFAILHLVWDGRAAIPQLPGLWLMGVTLTMAWWVDHQSIGLAWGLHSGWVWAIAMIDSFGLIQYHPSAPLWGIGLDQKILASLPGLAALILTGLGLWWFC